MIENVNKNETDERNKLNNKNKVKTAVAISYDADDTAPRIIASGKGYVADKMVQVAKESDVPVHKDEKLANTLSKLEIGEYIPSELYGVVAEVLLFVDNLDRIKSKVFPDKYTKK
nr:EscU/YscU/HrcU family type III secretion system export apparatus switch protein [Anaeromicropila herbilytica]